MARYRAYMLGQIEELLTRYGKIDIASADPEIPWRMPAMPVAAMSSTIFPSSSKT